MTDAVNDMPGRGSAYPRLNSTLRHALLIAVCIVMIYPILWMLSGSLRPASELFGGEAGLIPSQVTLSAYPDGWFGLQVTFGRFFANSLIISVLATIGNVLAASLVAYAFARLRFAGQNFWFALMLGTLMLPYHVTLIPQYVLFRELGWVNTWLPLIVPKYFAVDAFFIFLMVQFFRGIPRELDEAARMDGCSAWRIYRKIILPLSMPVLATAAIFSFIWTWEDFFGPLIYISEMENYTVQLGLRSFIDSSGTSSWNELFAMSILSLVPIFLIFLFFQRLLIEGIATTGMKR
ncbi:carbohydrate ABC transporter permease [Allosediminivita pacifica]|uniref:Carbohydrate ABC transporter membrane protein 2 (CUT1 family) n=1 Tax=Allosediminivita pacifica TaxID=1267769 RepID=A0A2T6AJF8_9RHOB|nr:carbohydrate ABC transporter permease [Allosediminivita pacifica]PTX43942.1 carbohydrate ABC transporter membrane protein 2 (CUT1 family) [Allosediminivita pacifica]GGB21505.1 sugar ABC transporter permease [Allosediminivita pacifica]